VGAGAQKNHFSTDIDLKGKHAFKVICFLREYKVLDKS
jgi:hypothetical protein